MPKQNKKLKKKKDFPTRPNVVLGLKDLPVDSFHLPTSLGSSACFLFPAFWQYLVIFDITSFPHPDFFLNTVFIYFKIKLTQCCVSFYCTAKWIRHKDTHISSLKGCFQAYKL